MVPFEPNDDQVTSLGGETGEEGWAVFAGQCPFLTFGAPFKQHLLKILLDART